MIRQSSVLLAILVSGIVFAQPPDLVHFTPSKAGSSTVTTYPPAIAGPVVTGAPYSADEVTEHTQTFANGLHISDLTRTFHMYRDSVGRTRSEGPMFVSRHAPEAPIIVEILDPVAGYRFILDTVDRVAHRSALLSRTPPSPGARLARPAQPAEPARGQAVTPDDVERLGTRTIEGVLADGSRQTTTIPTGQEGNDQPMAVVTEQWISRELRLTMLLKFSDPRTGERTTRVEHLSRAEPDQSLFLVPADYRVVDESGSVTIRIVR